jgi:chitinase
VPEGAADSTSPSIPSNLQATSNGGAITLRWNESSDNIGIANYRIYRDYVWIRNVSGDPIYVDQNVSSGGTYRYQVQALDAFGNLSGKSAAVIVTATSNTGTP